MDIKGESNGEKKCSLNTQKLFFCVLIILIFGQVLHLKLNLAPK